MKKYITNKNIRYITLLYGFFMTLFWGLDERGIRLFFFGGGDDYHFRFALDDDFLVITSFFVPYILAKLWQRYKAES